MWAGAGGPPNPKLLARDAYVEMMKTAQNVADRYELTREEIDAFALRSHQRAAAAGERATRPGDPPGRDPGNPKLPHPYFEHDESIRGDRPRKLAALPAQPNTTQMTAGNSSPLSDGAEYLPAGETPHCIDFILTGAGVKAEAASVMFAGTVPLPGGPGYVSDHVGLRASLFLAP